MRATGQTSEFSVKEETARVGSNIKRDTARLAVLPADKRYADLNDAQREALRSIYEDLGPGDEPPYPRNGLGNVHRAIAKGRRSLRGATGDLDMAVTVDSSGSAVSVEVWQSPDPETTRLVAGVLMLEKYKAAVCAGVPCKMQFPFRMKFVPNF